MKNVTQESNKFTSNDNDFSHLLDFLNTKSFKGDSVDNYKPSTKVTHEVVAKNNINNNEKTRMPVNDNNIIIEETLAVLKSIGTEIKLTEEQLQSLIKEYKYFITNFFKNKELQELEDKNSLYEKLKQFLGSDFKNKELLIKKASTWLGLDNLYTHEEYLNFLEKMSLLGKMISEDEELKNEQPSYVLTKEEAIQERNDLITNDKFKYALTNKMHPMHKEALNKLRQLNSIIVS